MDINSVIFGIGGLLLGVVSVILTVVFYLKPLIDKSLLMLEGLKQAFETQHDLLKTLSENSQRNSEDHVGIVSTLENLSSKIANETTDKVIERIKEILK